MKFNRIALTYLIALSVLIANLLWVGTWLGGPGSIALRLFTFLSLSFVLSRFFAYRRAKAVGQTLFVAFLDQVVFKAGFLVWSMNTDPQNWVGIEFGPAFFTLSMGFISFVPFILILAFLGSELSLVLERKHSPAATSS